MSSVNQEQELAELPVAMLCHGGGFCHRVLKGSQIAKEVEKLMK